MMDRMVVRSKSKSMLSAKSATAIKVFGSERVSARSPPRYILLRIHVNLKLFSRDRRLSRKIVIEIKAISV